MRHPALPQRRGHGRRAPALLLPLVVAATLPPAMARAQDPAAPPEQPPAACDGRVVTAVVVQPEPPTVIGRSAPGWSRPLLRVALQSWRTDTSAVRPFVLLQPGDVCTEFERAESERLLRAQPYLADASVRAVPDGDGVRIEVETVDDVPLIIGGALRGGRPSRVLFGNANVLGRGMLLAGEWERGGAYREGFGAHFEHYHGFGGRITTALHAVRGPLDAAYEVALLRPYLTDAQNLAWYAGYTRDERYVPFLRAGQPALALNVTRQLYGAAAIARVGPDRRRLLAGLSVAHERDVPDADPATIFAERYAPLRLTRAAASVGTRLLTFVRLEGLDALGGAHDVAGGVQLLGTVGYELAEAPAGGEDERRPFAAADLYAGTPIGDGIAALALSAEGRNAPDGWGDVVASGRLAWTDRVSDQRARTVSLGYMGGWETRRPYRVTLGAWEGGVRGYRGSRAAGARIGVLRLEERFGTGGLGSLAAFGVAVFGDVGKVWAGDVPLGVTTGLRASVGAGLLVAVPRRSQGFYRLDVAVPVMRDRDATSWTVRLSRSVPYASFWREPGDLTRARSARPATALLGTP